MARKPTVAIVIPSFNGVVRLTALLRSIERYDPNVFDLAPITIFEDPCGIKAIAKAYDNLERVFPVQVDHIPTWSNMHGAAKYAFQNVYSDWIIYLGDDVLVTPCALTNLVYFLRENKLGTVAAVQPAYWNAHELMLGCSTERQGPILLHAKEDMYAQDQRWLEDVPRNSHWDKGGTARAYINVNGAGFAVRRSTYRAVGGFADHTWCLDESLSVRIWQNSASAIVCLPGPPLVHHFGGSSGYPPENDAYTRESWFRGMNMTKEQAGEVCTKYLEERRATVEAEMANCKYYSEVPCAQ